MTGKVPRCENSFSGLLKKRECHASRSEASAFLGEDENDRSFAALRMARKWHILLQPARCQTVLWFVWVLSLIPGFSLRAQTGLAPILNEAESSVGPRVSPSSDAGRAPLILTFQDAMDRARRLDPQLFSATTEVELAHQDRVQARAAMLPSMSLSNQYLFTQGNGVLPSGRYVTNDGVHVYRVWGVFHQDFSANTLALTSYHRAAAAEALTRAKLEISRRGLQVTVAKAYYDLVVAERKYATAQQSQADAERFLKISQNLESGGEAAHSDVIKFQLQANQAQEAFREGTLTMENARLNLAVMLFSDFNQNFTVVDDLGSAPGLPPLEDIQAMAARENPQIRAALAAQREAQLDVSTARQAFLPSLAIDTDYGIEANALALMSRVSTERAAGRLPNLGYFMTANISLPVWNWGAMRSKLKQAEIHRRQAEADLNLAERQAMGNLLAAYNEAETARSETETLRQSAELAAESLRLNTLRYKAGEATVLELVDAARTLAQARNASDDGQARYRLAVANLQTFTGNF